MTDYGNELALFEKKPEKPMECTDFMEELIDNREGTVVDKPSEIPDVRTDVIGAVSGLYRFDETQCWVVMTADGIVDELSDLVMEDRPPPIGEVLWERQAAADDCKWLNVHYFTRPDLSDKVDNLVKMLEDMTDPWMKVHVTTKTGRLEAMNMDLVDAGVDVSV